MDESEREAAALELDGVLDLHAFRPADVPDLVPAWLGHCAGAAPAACRSVLDECKAHGIAEVRIHGEGKAVLRRTVHRILTSRDDVVTFALAPSHLGGWGATVATLRLGES